MSAKRARNMKHWAAARRKSRRIDAARTAEPAQELPSQGPGLQIQSFTAVDNGGYGMVIDGMPVYGGDVTLLRNGKGGLKARDADVQIGNLEIG